MLYSWLCRSPPTASLATRGINRNSSVQDSLEAIFSYTRRQAGEAAGPREDLVEFGQLRVAAVVAACRDELAGDVELLPRLLPE